MPFLVELDEVGDDVEADIAVQLIEPVDLADPVDVTASGVRDGADRIARENRGEGGPDGLGLTDLGAGTGD
ncbi:hypothetical protein Slala02_41810 [Streptomyces lavendulae subsp. lavendulae]|nr:hypothetical protein Slala01_53720 [Streptomyces lavendulae subsp. lavendulae]GLX28361.1 hypothetical protein Slala02_41810 [Streptomyces lavendulae subsp. lavendulae]